MSKKDLFNSLPLELLFAVLDFAMITEVLIFSETSKVLFILSKVNFMPTVPKFCLKQQNKDLSGLMFWMHASVNMNGLFLDNRIMYDCLKTADLKDQPLKDQHFSEKNLIHFSSLSTLVIRAGSSLTSKSFQNIAKTTGNLTTLGEMRHFLLQCDQN